MSSRFFPAPWADVNMSSGQASASTAAPANIPAAPHVHPELHTSYLKLTNGNNKCDGCQQSCNTCIQMCGQCGHTTCLQCHMNRRYDNRHILAHLQLDWSFDNEHSQGQRAPMAHQNVQILQLGNQGKLSLIRQHILLVTADKDTRGFQCSR